MNKLFFHAVDICSCKYRFIEQPANAVMCNPYDVGWLVTSCAVEFTTTEGIPLNLAWYRRDTSDSPPEVLIREFTTVNGESNVRSELNFTLTETMPETFEGHRYFCRVSFSNGTVIQDSQEFYLFSREVIMNVLDFPTCVNDSIQSVPFEECIDPVMEIPQPTTTLAPTSVISIPLPSPTASLVPPDSAPEDNPDDDVDINSADTALTSTEEILIYSAIGVAVFLL